MRDATLNQIRAALRARVDETSLRNTAGEVGISPGGLSNTMDGAVPHWKTMDLLRRWFVRNQLRQAGPPPIETYQIVLDAMVESIPEAEQSRAKLRLLDEVERLHRIEGCVPPEWLVALRAQTDV